MKQLEANLRSIEKEGLTWGASTLVPLAFGIKKLQVNLVVEDEKVSIDELQAQIEEDEDHVQSTDVVRDCSFPACCQVFTLTILLLSRPLCKNFRRYTYWIPQPVSSGIGL